MSKYDRFKSFSKLFLGNSIGQVIAVALYPYIAHFYLPSDFSTFGYIVSLTTLLSVFATGQFHTALLNPEREEEAMELIGLATIMVTVVSVLSFLYFVFYDRSLILVSIYLFVYSLNEIQKMYFIRKRMYSESSISQITFRLVGNGAKLFNYFISLKFAGLVLSEVLSLCLVVSYGFKKSIFNWRWHKKTFYKYKSFPLFQSSTIAMNLLILDFPILFWTNRFDKTELGYFVMGQKLILLPAIIVSNAIQGGSVHNFIESKSPFKSYTKLITGLISLGFIGVLFFEVAGLNVLILILGKNWSQGEEVFKLLAFFMITKFSYAISQATFVLRSVTKQTFLIRAFQLGLLFFFISPHFTFYESLKVYIIIDMTFDVILIALAGYIIRPPFVFRKFEK